jgi:thiamine kinase
MGQDTSALEELAERWVPGEGPVDIQPLASGLVNESYRVSRGGRLHTLRVAANSQDLGIDRQWEYRVLTQATAEGLAPVLDYCDPVQGILVAGWVDGRTWTADEIRQPNAIDTMAQLLRRVHSLPILEPARVMNPAAWIAHYAAALAGRGVAAPPRLAELSGAVDVHLKLLATFRQPRLVLCHSDLHRLNVVIGDSAVLLDWEYAHVSDPFWDLAGWIANNDWSEALTDRLSATYLRRPPDLDERSRLAALAWLYDYVCLMWSELYLNQRPGPASHEVYARADLLVTRLQRASGSRAG